MAYSEIQRETGTASSTLKRALQSLEADGTLEIKPGRNSRYGRFHVVQPQKRSEAERPHAVDEQPSDSYSNPLREIQDLTIQVENLRRRIRTQEMTIAILQERLAEVEDKLYKR